METGERTQTMFDRGAKWHSRSGPIDLSAKRSRNTAWGFNPRWCSIVTVSRALLRAQDALRLTVAPPVEYVAYAPSELKNMYRIRFLGLKPQALCLCRFATKFQYGRLHRLVPLHERFRSRSALRHESENAKILRRRRLRCSGTGCFRHCPNRVPRFNLVL